MSHRHLLALTDPGHPGRVVVQSFDHDVVREADVRRALTDRLVAA